MSSLSEEQRRERRRQQNRESAKRRKTAKDANKVHIEDLDAMKLSVANLEKTGALKDTRIILLEAENTLLKEIGDAGVASSLGLPLWLYERHHATKGDVGSAAGR